jgi:hypothetical protein
MPLLFDFQHAHPLEPVRRLAISQLGLHDHARLGASKTPLDLRRCIVIQQSSTPHSLARLNTAYKPLQLYCTSAQPQQIRMAARPPPTPQTLDVHCRDVPSPLHHTASRKVASDDCLHPYDIDELPPLPRSNGFAPQKPS